MTLRSRKIVSSKRGVHGHWAASPLLTLKLKELHKTFTRPIRESITGRMSTLIKPITCCSIASNTVLKILYKERMELTGQNKYFHNPEIPLISDLWFPLTKLLVSSNCVTTCCSVSSTFLCFKYICVEKKNGTNRPNCIFITRKSA